MYIPAMLHVLYLKGQLLLAGMSCRYHALQKGEEASKLLTSASKATFPALQTMSSDQYTFSDWLFLAGEDEILSS